MNNSQIFHVAKSRQKLDRKSSNEAIFKTLVIVHFYKFVEINAEKVEDATQMIPKDEVFSEFDDSFDAIRIAFLQEK